MKKSSVNWNCIKKYAIRKFSIGAASVIIGASVLPGVIATTTVHADTLIGQQVLSKDANIRNIITTYTNFDVAKVQGYIHQITNAEKVAPEGIQPEAYNAYQAVVSEAEQLVRNMEAVIAKGDSVKQQGPIILDELSRTVDPYRQDMNYTGSENGITEEQKQALNVRLDDILSTLPNTQELYSAQAALEEFLGIYSGRNKLENAIRAAKNAKLAAPLSEEFVSVMGEDFGLGSFEKIRVENIYQLTDTEKASLVGALKSWYEADWGNDIQEYVLSSEGTFSILFVDGTSVSASLDNIAKGKNNVRPAEPVIEVKEESRTEPVAYKTIRRANPALAEGQEQVVQAGVNGERRIVETVTLTDGKETSRVEKSNQMTKEPVDEVIEYGTKSAPVVETREESRTEPVAYKTVRRANPEQGVGYEQVVQQGQNGERTIVETVTLTDGVETGRVEKSNQITKEPVDEIIEYGTKSAPVVETREESRTETVAYKTVRRANPEQGVGYEQVVQQGQNGERTIVETVTLTDGVETGRVEKSNQITKEPVDEVIEYGTKVAPVVETKEETRTESIAYKTVRRANPEQGVGYERVVQAGVNGERRIVETVTLTDGKETRRVEKSNQITKEPVDEVIEYGTKVAPVVETREETRTETVAYKTVRRANPEQGVGYEQVVQAGVNGERTIVETVTLTDGKETGRVEKSNQITKEPVDEIIEYGTKSAPVVETKEETRTESVAYKTIRRANPEQGVGYEQVVQQGQNGERTIVETVTLTDGKETSRVEKSNQITKEPVDEIIEYGTKAAPVVETKEETHTETVAYKTVRRANPEQGVGYEQVVQQGQNGERTIVETVTLTDGVETSRVEKSNQITKEPVDEIIEYGTKSAPVVETKEETHTETVAYKTVRRANPEQGVGYEQVVQVGVNGERRIVETVTLTDGKETSRVEKSNQITKEPVDEIIEYGTKSAPVVETREESRTEPVAYKTVRRANPEQGVGYEQVVQAGVNGERTIVETVTLTDGVETSRVEKSNQITKEPVDEIIEYGTKSAPVVETREETRTELIAYKTVRRANPEQGVGYEQVVQAGVNGERTIVETVTLTNGKETSRVEKSNQITKEPVDEIIEYGTKAAPIIGTTKGGNLDSNKNTNFLSMDERELPPLQKDVKEPKNQQVLPQTGEITQLFLPLATFMIVTASAVIDLKPRKKE
ncbi:G5 domain-containing protein [Streptococcus azizii]|uniref:G5 domain-containing protein n=1 Tax=Streptococcus azizii TaxID=1579424 RepID=A0AB36JUC8_9STRE|nr:G5 domain-containing protein [Streptococcus azizii]ONK29123.1 hypothetical protein BVE86_01130 [Streptococcus azizii]